ncbi:anti-sigma B factor RsbW [Geomicrobium sediminis]|uniref:Serine/threonine-protein kinase RsbW n=1 Tax=Geomicrobium sediminis TaxID=1347788 RepID=A0ABS2PG83_9BACL|nr:anti-sigma B factor RsbW [Geomicrobium sediminis]MBM7634443.1 serine/threonine-protein kinase RsbW [Geomicrobium sediminis]
MSSKNDSIEMSVPAKAEYIGILRLTASGIANRVGYSYDVIEDIKVSMAEACTNVVDHAYKDGSGDIKVKFDLCNDYLQIQVSDEGTEKKTLAKSNGPVDANKPIEELQEGGLGLFLIETLMDEVEITQDNGVTITMKKFVQRDEVAQGADGVETTANN